MSQSDPGKRAFVDSQSDSSPKPFTKTDQSNTKLERRITSSLKEIVKNKIAHNHIISYTLHPTTRTETKPESNPKQKDATPP